jgi:electron transfer flavoprotein alpha subunit
MSADGTGSSATRSASPIPSLARRGSTGRPELRAGLVASAVDEPPTSINVPIPVRLGGGKPVSPSTTELADRLQGDVVGVSIGSNHDDSAVELTAYGADRVLRLEGPQLADYSPEGYANALALIQSSGRFDPSDGEGRDFAPRVAAHSSLGNWRCHWPEIDEQERLVQLKPAFGGNIVAHSVENVSADGTVRHVAGHAP